MLHQKYQPQYFPKNIPFAKPKGENIVEFAIFVRDEIGVFAAVSQVFAKHNIKVREIFSNELEDNELGYSQICGFFCDFSAANCTIEQVESDLRAISAVVDVQEYDMKDKIWDRFFFPTSVNGKRIVMMRLEPLLRIERNLIERLGTAGAAIMFNEGEVYANETFEDYKRILPNVSSERLLQCAVDGLRATGWGIVEFEKLSAGYEVRITDPPILNDPEYNENRFLYGLVTRTLELIYGISFFLSESGYDEKSKLLTLKFAMRSALTIPVMSER